MNDGNPELNVLRSRIGMTKLSSDTIRGTLNKQGVRAEVTTKMKEGRDNIKFGFIERCCSVGHWFIGNVGVTKWIVTEDKAAWKRSDDPKIHFVGAGQAARIHQEDPVDVMVCNVDNQAAPYRRSQGKRGMAGES
mmetsp:Transcript_26925/g.40747  ORF Transcript_26925/g.40747 Transcript_26925/m.40747 type:complete len:135 (+) Transcript_26925:324-728(+)